MMIRSVRSLTALAAVVAALSGKRLNAGAPPHSPTLVS